MGKMTKAFVLAVLVLCLCASLAAAARLPKVTMLSTRTCPACVQMTKVLKQIDAQYAGRLATQHVYLEESPELVEKYNIRYVPVLIFVDGKGQEVAQEVGYHSLEQVLSVFKKHGVKI
ncbi:MAG: thioredoxin family protein [Synergistaceae bacterium]|nr:thioredoxin family protein [Synergistaceae bacterium]